MDLNSLSVDLIAVEQGQWVDNIPDLGDIRLKVRGMGNAVSRKKQQDLYRALPMAKRTDATELEKIQTQITLDTILLDWSGLTDNGEDVHYSHEMAAKILNDPRYQPFKDGVTWASQVVAEMRNASAKSEGKNLLTS